MTFDLPEHTRLEVETSPGVWTDVTGASRTISVQRRDGDPGTLSAEVLDASLDPTQTAAIRLGRGVRLRVTDAAGTGWTPTYTGVLDNVEVDYNPLAPEGRGTNVKFSGVDLVAKMANVSEHRGVATIEELRWLAADFPFLINGSSTPLATGTVVATNDNASLWDQILTTRDTALGHAWVDPQNRLRVYDAAQMPAPPAGVVASINSGVYRSVDTDFTLAQVINSVVVNWRRYNIGSETSADIPYGPYEDAPSIADWGRRQASFTIQGATEVEADIAAYGADVLARNKDAVVRARSATIPIRALADLALVRDVDLNSLVQVTLPDGVTVQTLRVTGIDHHLTTRGWIITWEFTTSGGVASPSGTPGTGISTVPPGTITETELAPEIVTSLESADGKTRNYYQTTAPTGGPFTVGDTWFDTDDGNKIHRWSGTAWVATLIDTAAIANAAIETAQIDSAAVIREKIANAAVDTTKIDNLAVTSALIADAAIGTAKIADLAVASAKIANAAIVNAKIGDGEITNAKIADATIQSAKIGNLDAGKITTGTLSADRIGANAIGVDKLLVGVGTNSVSNPGAEDGTVSPHVSFGGTWAAVTNPKRSGSYGFRCSLPDSAGTGYRLTLNGSRNALAGKLPVKLGDTVRFEFYARSGSTATWNAIAYIDQLTRDGSVVTNGQYDTAKVGESRSVTMTTAYQKVVAEVTITDSTVAYVGAAVATNAVTSSDVLHLDDFYFGKQVTGELLVNGAIWGKEYRTNTGFDDIEIIPGNASTPSKIKFISDGPYYDTSDPAGLSCYDFVEAGIADTVAVTLQGAKVTGFTTLPRIDILSRRTFGGNLLADLAYHAGGSGINGTHRFYINGNERVRISDDGLTLGSGNPIRAINFGQRSGNTDSLGNISFNHGLGSLPGTIQITGDTVHPRMYLVGAKDGTSVTVRVKNNDGTNASGTSVTFYWLVMAF